MILPLPPQSEIIKINTFNIYCNIYCFEILLRAGNRGKSSSHSVNFHERNNSQSENKVIDDGNTRSKTDSEADSKA